MRQRSQSLALAALLCVTLSACTLPPLASPPPEVLQIARRDGVDAAPALAPAPQPLSLAADIMHIPPGPTSVAPNAARREPPVDVPVSARPLARPMPRYPAALLEEGLDGRVVASFVVNSAGRVEAVEIAAASHPLFATSVREALKGWRFEPARSSTGQAVPSRMRVPFRFRLED